jgi:hypothetical protein
MTTVDCEGGAIPFPPCEGGAIPFPPLRRGGQGGWGGSVGNRKRLFSRGERDAEGLR